MHIAARLLPLPAGFAAHLLFNWRVMEDVAESKCKHVTKDVCALSSGRKLPNVGQKATLSDRHKGCSKPSVSTTWRAYGIEGVEVEQFRSCECNEYVAVLTRVALEPAAVSDSWRKWFSEARPMGQVIAATEEEWASRLPSRARGLVKSANLGGLTRKDLTIKAFVKREKRVSRVGARLTKAEPDPRLIQGRSVAVKVATGPFTWAYGKRLSTVYNSRGRFMYAGGASAEEVGRFYDHNPAKDGYSWVAIDCKRWDRSVGPVQMECLHHEYRHCGADDECLRALEGRDGVRTGVTSHGLRFKRVAQVASGDGDTSCGNSRLHLVMLETCDAVRAAVVSGDDAMILTNNVNTVLDRYREGGFVPVLADDTDFCSQLFWPTQDGTVLGPKIGRLLAKTFVSTKPFTHTKQLEWLRGNALGLRHSCSFVPILRVLIPRLLELTGKGKVWREDGYKYKVRANLRHVACNSTWDFFTNRYGIGEAEVLDMESEIACMQLGDVLSHPALVLIVDRDN